MRFPLRDTLYLSDSLKSSLKVSSVGIYRTGDENVGVSIHPRTTLDISTYRSPLNSS